MTDNDNFGPFGQNLTGFQASIAKETIEKNRQLKVSDIEKKTSAGLSKLHSICIKKILGIINFVDEISKFFGIKAKCNRNFQQNFRHAFQICILPVQRNVMGEKK